MSKLKQVTTGVFWLTGVNVALYALGFINNVALTRMLSPATFGTFAMGAYLFDLLQRPRVMGVFSLIVKQPLDEEDIQIHFQLRVVLSAFVLCICLAAAPFLVHKYGRTVIAVMLVCAAASMIDTEGMAGTPLGLLERSFGFRRISKTDLIANVTKIISGLTLAAAGFGVWSLVFSQEILLALVVMWGYWGGTQWRPKLKWKWDRARVKWFLLTHGGFVWLQGWFNFFTLTLDIAMVGTVLGVTQLGYYNRAWSLAQMPLMFLGSVGRVAFPLYSSVKGDPVQSSKAFSEVQCLMLRVGLWFSLMFWCASPDIVGVLYGAKWAPVAPILTAFCLLTVARPIFDSVNGFFVAFDRPKLYFYFSVLQAAICLASVWFGLRKWGAQGAAAAVGFTMLVAIALMLMKIRQLSSMPIRIGFWRAMLALAVPVLAFELVRWYGIGVSLPLFLSLVLKLTMVTALYGLGLFIWDRENLNKMLGRFLQLAKQRS